MTMPARDRRVGGKAGAPGTVVVGLAETLGPGRAVTLTARVHAATSPTQADAMSSAVA